MPSDDRTARAFEAVASRAAQFRAALTAAHAEMHAYAAEHRAPGRDHGEATALGAFASGRIDATRLGAVLTDPHALGPESESRIAQCAAVLEELLERDSGLFTHSVAIGEPLRSTVDRAYAEIGRAFGAIRAFGAVKTGSYQSAKHASLLAALPFPRWSRRERDMAPPLVIELEGADVRAEQLAEYLDGEAKIVLVVTGEASPAPLVRLVAPYTLVMQVDDVAALAPLAGFAGPAIAAVVPKTSALFVHDPRLGAPLDERLAITRIPAQPPGRTLGWRSARQQAEELAQLATLSEVTAAARDVSVVVVPPLPEGAAAVDGTRAVDAVASWLLAQAGLTGGVK